MPDFSVAIAFLKKPIDDLYAAAAGSLKGKLSRLRTVSRVKALHKKLYETQRVKTIWNPDRPQSLTSFFYPVSIKTQAGSARLNSLDDLPDNRNIIFGTVGQGKSILLRYLLGREIKSGHRVPVLVELRGVESSSLEDAIRGRFNLLLGIDSDAEVFASFALAGKLSIFLDGFDEIDSDRVQSLTQQIDDLSYRYQNCRIVVTSRPDSECRHLTQFVAQRIAPLSDSDLESFYRKITKDSEFTARLVAAIRVSPLKIRELVTTPLLATLLAISYRAVQRIPLDFSEFYEDLFEILLVRHDSSKLGWRRKRKTKLNDREIQQVFEAFCFASRKKKMAVLDRDVAYDLARESIAELRLQADPQGFVEDIKKITCLLLEEGKKLSFVHLSVQEFFASRYIKTCSERVAAKFYEQILAGKWEDWGEELLFLRQIDGHRARKYFLMPDLQRTLTDLESSPGVFDFDAFESYLSGMLVVRKVDDRSDKKSVGFYIKRVRLVNTQHYRRVDQAAYDVLFSRSYEKAESWRSGFDLNPDCTSRTYLEIAHDRGGGVYDELYSRILSSISGLSADLVEWQQRVSHCDAPRGFTDIG